jgi:hypothetical protein
MNDITTKTIGALLEAQTLTASVNGPAVSLTGFEGNVDVIARIGTPTGTTPTLSLQLQTSPDGSTAWANVGPVLGAFTTAAGGASANLNPAGCLQYVRVVATVGGTTPSFPVAVLYIAAPQYH